MKKQRMVCIQDPVFHVPIVCVWGATSKQFAATLRKHFNVDATNVLTCSGVFFAEEVEGRTVGFIGIADTFDNTPENYAILSHECLHATFHMLKDRGVAYSSRTEESYTYYHSFLLSTLATEMLRTEERLERRRLAHNGQ